MPKQHDIRDFEYPVQLESVDMDNDDDMTTLPYGVAAGAVGVPNALIRGGLGLLGRHLGTQYWL